MTVWYWVANYPRRDDPEPKVYVLSHIVPDSLLEEIVGNLKARGADLLRTEVISDTVGGDLGGSVFTDSHKTTILLDGLVWKLPSSHVPELLDRVIDLPPRIEISSYFKLHLFFNRCLCLTPYHRALLMEQLELVLAECEAIEAAENERFNDKIVGSPFTEATPKPVKKKLGRS